MADTNVSTPTGVAPGAPQISTTPADKAAPTSARASTTRMARIPNDENEVIVNCMKAWNYAYKKEAANLDDDESDYPAQKAGNEAYLRAIPPLVGYENICQFIACINFAVMTDIITYSDAKHYRANAKLALTAVLRKPKPSPGPAGTTDSTNSTNSTATTPQPSKPAPPEEK